MTLSGLVTALRQASSHQMVHELIELLERWRNNADTADDLYHSVERVIGNLWMESDEEQKTIYMLWMAFRDECIAGRGGMNINERLYCFDLFDAWDNAETEEDRAVIRHKIDFLWSEDGA